MRAAVRSRAAQADAENGEAEGRSAVGRRSLPTPLASAGAARCGPGMRTAGQIPAQAAAGVGRREISSDSLLE